MNLRQEPMLAELSRATKYTLECAFEFKRINQGGGGEKFKIYKMEHEGASSKGNDDGESHDFVVGTGYLLILGTGYLLILVVIVDVVCPYMPFAILFYGRGGGPEFGVGQERLGPSCSGHGGGAKHSQTAFKQS